jgi:glycosyltransferase involved in cell wall biosynthesis
MLDVMTADSSVLFESIHHVESRVTVIVTLYDYADFVTEALDSVETQDLEHLDLVVVDDASTDGGEQRVLEWLQSSHERFGRAMLLRHAHNQGLAAARNQGFSAAATPYVFVLDADNQLYPRCLTACLETAERNRADMVYTILEVFGEHQGIMGTDVWDPIALQEVNYIDAMALISRAAWADVGGYRRMRTAGWEDYDFWLKFAEAGLDALRVPEILCRYRHHSRSMLRSVTNQPATLDALHADMRLHHPAFRLGGS